MKEKLISLLGVKSIITIMISIVFCYLGVVGKIAPDKFQDLFYIVISFYFGSQVTRRDNAIQNVNNM